MVGLQLHDPVLLPILVLQPELVNRGNSVTRISLSISEQFLIIASPYLYLFGSV
jgi:hypothetical protein